MLPVMTTTIRHAGQDQSTEESPADSLEARAGRPTFARFELRAIFGISLLANLAAAWWLSFVAGIGNGDALSRTANAFYVIFSRDPHLAAIGFVWPPLPSFLQLPLLPIARWVGQVEFSGPVLSALFGAGSLVVLNRVIAELSAGRALRWTLLALTQLHPEFWYLAGSGMAEPVLLFSLLLALLGYLRMPRLRAAILAATGLAMGVFVRYETLGMIAGIVGAVLIQRWPPWRNWEQALEGRLLTLLAPPVYALFLWLFWNWQVMGDPLFFQRSAYSLSAAPDVARNLGPSHPYYQAWGNVWITLAIAVSRLGQQNWAFLVAALATTVLAWLRRDRFLAGLVIILMSLPVFTASQVFAGSLASWMRYWFYATPFAAILIAAVGQATRGAARSILLAAPLTLMLGAPPVSLVAMGNQTAMQDEQRLSDYFLSPSYEVKLRESDKYWASKHDSPILAERVDALSNAGLVLLDSETSFGVIMASRHPERFAITSDRDFERLLAEPQKYVRYILLVDSQVTGGQRDKISGAYPDLFRSGAPWAVLEDDFPPTIERWRLYGVKTSTGRTR